MTGRERFEKLRDHLKAGGAIPPALADVRLVDLERVVLAQGLNKAPAQGNGCAYPGGFPL